MRARRSASGRRSRPFLCLAPICTVIYVAMPLRATAQTPQRIHQDLHAILSSKDFQSGPLKESDLNRSVKNLAEWVVRHAAWLRRLRLVPQLGSGWRIHSTPGLEWLVLFLTFGAGVWLGIKLWPSIRFAAANRRLRARSNRAAPAAVKLVPAAITPEAHLESAQGLAKNGEYRAAFRAAYLALMGFSARAAGCRLSDGWTNVETAKRLAPLLAPAASTAFHRQTAQFDPIWYGSSIANAGQVEACISECVRMNQPRVES